MKSAGGPPCPVKYATADTRYTPQRIEGAAGQIEDLLDAENDLQSRRDRKRTAA